MSARSNAARQEAEQYDRASQPQTRPWNCEVLADLFGLTIHLEGRQLHIPYDRVEEVIEQLRGCKWIERSPSILDRPAGNPDIQKANNDFMSDPVGRVVVGE